MFRDPVVMAIAACVMLAVIVAVHSILFRKPRKPPHPERLIQHVLDVSQRGGYWEVYCEVYHDDRFDYEVFKLVELDPAGKLHFFVDSDDYEVTNPADFAILEEAVSSSRLRLVS